MLSKHDRDTRAQTAAAAGHRKPKPREPFSFMLYWNDSSVPSQNDAKAMRHTCAYSDLHCVHGETEGSRRHRFKPYRFPNKAFSPGMLSEDGGEKLEMKAYSI